MKVFIKGLNSCAMRKQKLQQYEDYLLANGHSLACSPKEADYILVWSCAFRADVRDNSVNEIIRYDKEYGAKIILAGCLPDIEPRTVEILPAEKVVPWRGDRVLEEIFGNQKPLESFTNSFGEEAICVDAAKFRKEFPEKDATFHDQFIKLVISEGCQFDCAYCSEKLAFPAYHSFPLQDLAAVCEEMIRETGRKEIILLADSLGNYGVDIGSSFPELLKTLAGVAPDLRFALNNLNPASFIEFWDEMTDFIKRGIIAHLNLPIQSASDKVLKLMNRAYEKKDLTRIFSHLNDIGFTEFDTHVIAGFPGETEADFDETIDFILKHRPKYVLGSAFMESPGMPAASLPDKVEHEAVKLRLKRLAEQMTCAGIIANTDDSELSAERFRRLNLMEDGSNE